MKPSPPEIQHLSPHASLWCAYDPSVKAELFSTAIASLNGTCLIDPIPLDPASLVELQARNSIFAIAITNQNHWRGAAELRSQLSVKIYAHEAAQLPESAQTFTAISDGQQIAPDLKVITIDGAAPGEIALFSSIEGGSLIVGDALINFEPYGFTFLPPKYCSDHRTMKKSLRRLMDLEIARIFFAHGSPIVSQAADRLRGLLEGQ